MAFSGSQEVLEGRQCSYEVCPWCFEMMYVTLENGS
jgi:hypothetical protein